jgi:NitT/TauT family transport system substrate-binding protein
LKNGEYPEMKIHQWPIFLLIIVLMLTACSPAAPTAPAALVPVNVCYSAISGTQTIVPYAFEKDIFKKYGLDVKLSFISGGSASTTALIAGNMDFCQIGGTSIVNAVIAKQDTVLIGGLFNVFPAYLMAKPEIKSLADLKGKTIGINEIGGSTDTIMRYALKQNGIDPDKDVTLVNAGDTPSRLAAMEAGKVAASIFIPPSNLQAKEKGYVPLLDLTKLGVEYQNTAIGTTRKYIKSHPDVAVNFMKAVIEAVARMKKDPEGTKVVIAKYTKVDPQKSAAALDETYQDLILKDLADIPYPTTAGIQFIIDSTVATNPDAAKITPDMIVDTSILKSLEDSGFISSFKK